MLSTLLSFLGASILLTIAPGPDNIYVLVQGITNGKKAGIILTSGLVSGILIHTTLVAFGVSVLIQKSPFLFHLIQYLGAGYLLYLAYKAYKSNSKISVGLEDKKHTSWQLFKRGFFMNVLNPKVSLFFLALLPGFVWNTKEFITLQLYTLGAIFMLQAFIIFSIIAIFAERINSFLTKKSISSSYFNYLQIFTFVGIAVYLLIP